MAAIESEDDAYFTCEGAPIEPHIALVIASYVFMAFMVGWPRFWSGGFMLFIFLLVLGWMAMAFIVPKIFQLLWNTTVPQIFGLRTIRYWQAFRLLLMAGLLASPAFFHFNFNR